MMRSVLRLVIFVRGEEQAYLRIGNDFFRAIELYEEAHRQRTCRVPATSELMVAPNGLSAFA